MLLPRIYSGVVLEEVYIVFLLGKRLVGMGRVVE